MNKLTPLHGKNGTLFVGGVVASMMTCIALAEPEMPSSEDPKVAGLRLRADSLKRIHGSGHFQTREAWVHLANLLTDENRYKESAEIWRLIVESRESSLGHTSWKTVDAYYNLGLMLERAGQFEEAELALEHCVSLCPIKPGDGGLLLDYYGLLSYVQCKLEHWVKAGQTCRLWLALRHTHVDTEATAHRRLALALVGMKAFSEADLEMQIAIQRYEGWQSLKTYDGVEANLILTQIRRQAGKFVDAEQALRLLLSSAEQLANDDLPLTLMICNELALCLRDQGRIRDATDFSSRACQGIKRWPKLEELRVQFETIAKELSQDQR